MEWSGAGERRGAVKCVFVRSNTSIQLHATRTGFPIAWPSSDLPQAMRRKCLPLPPAAPKERSTVPPGPPSPSTALPPVCPTSVPQKKDKTALVALRYRTLIALFVCSNPLRELRPPGFILHKGASYHHHVGPVAQELTVARALWRQGAPPQRQADPQGAEE